MYLYFREREIAQATFASLLLDVKRHRVLLEGIQENVCDRLDDRSAGLVACSDRWRDLNSL